MEYMAGKTKKKFICPLKYYFISWFYFELIIEFNSTFDLPDMLKDE